MFYHRELLRNPSILLPNQPILIFNYNHHAYPFSYPLQLRSSSIDPDHAYLQCFTVNWREFGSEQPLKIRRIQILDDVYPWDQHLDFGNLWLRSLVFQRRDWRKNQHFLPFLCRSYLGARVYLWKECLWSLGCVGLERKNCFLSDVAMFCPGHGYDFTETVWV